MNGNWIKCSERMPDSGQLVLVWCGGRCDGDGVWTVGWWDARTNPPFWQVTDEYADSKTVTHWQPLPEPPQEVVR